jgi:hypothetical protein
MQAPAKGGLHYKSGREKFSYSKVWYRCCQSWIQKAETVGRLIKIPTVTLGLPAFVHLYSAAFKGRQG